MKVKRNWKKRTPCYGYVVQYTFLKPEIKKAPMTLKDILYRLQIDEKKEFDEIKKELTYRYYIYNLYKHVLELPKIESYIKKISNNFDISEQIEIAESDLNENSKAHIETPFLIFNIINYHKMFMIDIEAKQYYIDYKTNKIKSKTILVYTKQTSDIKFFIENYIEEINNGPIFNYRPLKDDYVVNIDVLSYFGIPYSFIYNNIIEAEHKNIGFIKDTFDQNNYCHKNVNYITLGIKRHIEFHELHYAMNASNSELNKLMQIHLNIIKETEKKLDSFINKLITDWG